MNILESIIRKISSALSRKAADKIVDDVTSAVKNSAASKEITFDKLPENLDELKALPQADLTDPYGTAALTVAALCEFAFNRDASIEMLNYLKGPRPMSQMEISFVKDRFMDGVDYIPRSYLQGSSPENDYTPTRPYTVKVMEFAHSRDNFKDGYLRLFIRSSGADSERFVDLRLKPSTNQWFLWEFGGILSGIRIPKSKDAWA